MSSRISVFLLGKVSFGVASKAAGGLRRGSGWCMQSPGTGTRGQLLLRRLPFRAIQYAGPIISDRTSEAEKQPYYPPLMKPRPLHLGALLLLTYKYLLYRERPAGGAGGLWRRGRFKLIANEILLAGIGLSSYIANDINIIRSVTGGAEAVDGGVVCAIFVSRKTNSPSPCHIYHVSRRGSCDRRLLLAHPNDTKKTLQWHI